MRYPTMWRHLLSRKEGKGEGEGEKGGGVGISTTQK